MTGRATLKTVSGSVRGVSGLQDDGGKPALAFRNNLEL